MSRSFRESYLGKPYQAIRGWYQGRKRRWAKMARYRLAAMYDEDGQPDLPSVGGRKWRSGMGWHYWQKPNEDYEIIIRVHRKFLRLRPGRRYRKD